MIHNVLFIANKYKILDIVMEKFYMNKNNEQLFKYFSEEDKKILENLHVEVKFNKGAFLAKLYDGEFYYTGRCVSDVGALRYALDDYKDDK